MVLSLKDKQARIQEALDFDQIREVRLALQSRMAELGKLEKKETELGINSHECRELQRIIGGTDTEPGLLGIIRQHGPATEQSDVFYDRDPAECRHEDIEVGEDVSVCRGCGQLMHLVAAEAEEALVEGEFEVIEEEVSVDEPVATA